MGLDIQFLDASAAAAELDGTRLTTLPGFLNFARVLGPLLTHLNDPDDRERLDTYRGVVCYAEQHPEAAERLRQYLAFAVRFMEHAGAQPELYTEPPGISRDQEGWMPQVLEKYNRCLKVASEENAAFHISC